MPHKKKLTSLSVSVQLIERRIYLIRGQKVMIDFDLAELYGVPTRQLNQQVTRNKKRFPADFMFRLTTDEAEALRSQFVISNTGRGGRRYLPYAFTEQGVAMLSSDRDLAELYGVETRTLTKAVRRNLDRFPPDFMFELTRDEIEGISQFVTSSNLKFSNRVTVFTEQADEPWPLRR